MMIVSAIQNIRKYFDKRFMIYLAYNRPVKLNIVSAVMLCLIFVLNEIIIFYYDNYYTTPISFKYINKCAKCNGTFKDSTLFFLIAGYTIPALWACLGLSVHNVSKEKTWESFTTTIKWKRAGAIFLFVCSWL